MILEELLQKINKADYENLDKVVISVSDLLILRRAILDKEKTINGLTEKLNNTERKYNMLVSKHLQTYKEINEV